MGQHNGAADKVRARGSRGRCEQGREDRPGAAEADLVQVGIQGECAKVAGGLFDCSTFSFLVLEPGGVGWRMLRLEDRVAKEWECSVMSSVTPRTRTDALKDGALFRA